MNILVLTVRRKPNSSSVSTENLPHIHLYR